ncbi:5-oxoprolinase subunit PxpB [Plebeiibacterium sediminum]|uniref:5-oxoprolinase subunit PxpB n=1 Tax=Plebeiibacterium sediminum TaxID=2992112 RepID=A0AAE3M2Z2_9BACT|nr:5-oxoprolinase subunit PxpB [Plebeiobacterium sediminum]MCW3786143.1 5-oxoprolinase subunit PxpB [Plebeiobacterium sediminum]
MFNIYPSGDSAFLLKFGNEISEDIHLRIRAYLILLSKKRIKGITEVVPSYCDILVHYNPLIINYPKLISKLKKVYLQTGDLKLPEPKTVRIPVVYGGEYGPDINEVSKHTGRDMEEIINLHTNNKYLVYMLGFTPGFCYLGGMNTKLATPRKDKPSEKIAPGSVGIAGSQTGIYPIESPGGWQIIGRTPLHLFDPSSDNPFLIEAGNYIEFYPITENEFNSYL